MKKINVTVVAWLLLGSLTMSSCIGSFTLFNKFAKWETQMTSNKYVNAIVGFIITPFVGSVCLLGDALLFNTIEFWSGSNPIADIGKTRTIMATVNGEPRTYTLDEAGVYQARMDANEGMYFAVR